MKRVLLILMFAAPFSIAAAEDAKPPAKTVAKETRFVPAIKDGKPHGVKVYAIQLGSRHHKQGFKNGDTIVSVDGEATTSATEQAFREVLLDGTRGGKVDLDRAGKRMTLTVEKLEEPKK